MVLGSSLISLLIPPFSVFQGFGFGFGFGFGLRLGCVAVRSFWLPAGIHRRDLPMFVQARGCGWSGIEPVYNQRSSKFLEKSC